MTAKSQIGDREKQVNACMALLTMHHTLFGVPSTITATTLTVLWNSVSALQMHYIKVNYIVLQICYSILHYNAFQMLPLTLVS